MQHRQEALSQERLRQLARDPTNVIYQPTYDVVFEPWTSRRVETALRRIITIACSCDNEAAARNLCQQDDELRLFSSLYQKFYEKFTTPSIARNPEHVHVAMEMLRCHAEMTRGKLSEDQARAKVSDIALASLLRQAPDAPTPPSQVADMIFDA